MPTQQAQLQINEIEKALEMRELLEQGLIKKETDEWGQEVYNLTDKGRRALGQTEEET